MIRQSTDTFLKGLNRLILRIFFRRIERVGLDRVPEKGPMLAVGNHGNMLLDPMLVMDCLPHTPRFLAKSVFWNHAPSRALMKIAAAIPVYRRHDPGVDTSRNVEMFAAAQKVLAEGEIISLFPEGISHAEPHLMPVKTGAARIALGAELDYGPLGVQILPVGLTYEQRDKFRSRVLVRVGRPIDPAPEIVRARSNPAQAARALSRRIEEALRGLTLNYDSWDDMHLIERAVQIYMRPEEDPTGRGKLADRFGLRRAFIEGARELRETDPETIEQVARATERYDRLLELMRIDDAHVVAKYPPSLITRFLGRSLTLLFLRLPIALIGGILNFLPYWTIRIISRIAARRMHLPATYKVLLALFLYPLAWLAEGILIGRTFGSGWGWLTALTAPFTGYVALLFLERWELVLEETRAFLVLRTRKRIREELRSRRREISARVGELVEKYQQEESVG